jgi:hypothetical protein
MPAALGAAQETGQKVTVPGQHRAPVGDLAAGAELRDRPAQADRLRGIPQFIVYDPKVRDRDGQTLARRGVASAPLAGLRVSDGVMLIPDQLADIEAISEQPILAAAREGLMIPVSAASRRGDAIAHQPGRDLARRLAIGYSLKIRRMTFA